MASPTIASWLHALADRRRDVRVEGADGGPDVVRVLAALVWGGFDPARLSNRDRQALKAFVAHEAGLTRPTLVRVRGSLPTWLRVEREDGGIVCGDALVGERHVVAVAHGCRRPPDPGPIELRVHDGDGRTWQVRIADGGDRSAWWLRVVTPEQSVASWRLYVSRPGRRFRTLAGVSGRLDTTGRRRALEAGLVALAACARPVAGDVRVLCAPWSEETFRQPACWLRHRSLVLDRALLPAFDRRLARLARGAPPAERLFLRGLRFALRRPSALEAYIGVPTDLPLDIGGLRRADLPTPPTVVAGAPAEDLRRLAVRALGRLAEDGEVDVDELQDTDGRAAARLFVRHGRVGLLWTGRPSTDGALRRLRIVRHRAGGRRIDGDLWVAHGFAAVVRPVTGVGYVACVLRAEPTAGATPHLLTMRSAYPRLMVAFDLEPAQERTLARQLAAFGIRVTHECWSGVFGWRENAWACLADLPPEDSLFVFMRR